MPHYDYECKDCKKTFSIFKSIKDSLKNVSCPECGSKDVFQNYSPPSVSVAGLPKDRFK